jgi:5-methylcytosine-specific restriction enzyme B
MSQKQHYTVAGHNIALDKETVEYKLATIKAQPIDLVYVKVGGEKFPVKQVFAEATGLIKSQFTTQDAVRVLNGIGFDPKEQRDKTGKKTKKKRKQQ